MWAIILTKQITVPMDFPDKCQKGCFISASRGVLKVYSNTIIIYIVQMILLLRTRESPNVCFNKVGARTKRRNPIIPSSRTL